MCIPSGLNHIFGTLHYSRWNQTHGGQNGCHTEGCTSHQCQAVKSVSRPPKLLWEVYEESLNYYSPVESATPEQGEMEVDFVVYEGFKAITTGI